MVTYTLNQTPVHKNRYDGASEAAKVMSELFERLLELDQLKHDSAANMVRRLATLADLSPRGFRLVLRVGSGDTAAVLSSYEEQAEHAGVLRQTLHWRFAEDLKKIAYCFPEIATMLQEYRNHIPNKEGPMSAADGLRQAMEDRE
jgi:hypothetical protein